MNLKGASERGDDLLTSALIPKLKDTEMLLAKFKKELYDNFGLVSLLLPDVTSTIDTPVVTSQLSQTAVTYAAPSSSPPSHAAAPETTHQPLLPTPTPHFPSNQPETHVSAISDPIRPRQRLIARVISSVKCWGGAVADRHDT
ncbi:hypothetical protein BJ165DRAFT_1533467 [Panaeolus papilionaceus]|nr:hypothetical protein BJ165DRAFT_1533467 [Panaeolus papilionaceus]